MDYPGTQFIILAIGSTEINCLHYGLQTSFVKGQRVSILGVSGNTVSVVAPQFCCWGVKQPQTSERMSMAVFQENFIWDVTWQTRFGPWAAVVC